MIEEINDLDSLIGAFNKVLDKEYKLLSETVWFGIKDFKQKNNIFKLHYDITKKVVEQSDKIYKSSLEVGRNSDDSVKDVLTSAEKFFSLFNKNVDEYIETTSYTDNANESSDFTKEVDFQSELTKSQFTLQEKMKKVLSASTQGSLSLELFNNVKIPAILSEMAEKTNPEIVTFLAERRRKENGATQP